MITPVGIGPAMRKEFGIKFAFCLFRFSDKNAPIGVIKKCRLRLESGDYVELYPALASSPEDIYEKAKEVELFYRDCFKDDSLPREH